MTTLRDEMAVSETVPFLDWEARTAGAARYTTDHCLPGMLHARVLRSPHPHARIDRIDLSAARTAPGVVAVICGADLPDRLYGHLGEPFSDRRVFATEIVRFIGEEVAAVAAETPEQAEAALDLIRVDFHRLRAATTTDQALGRRAPRIHSECDDNVAFDLHRVYGDPRDARVRATTTVSGSYRYPRVSHLCMEVHAIVARWEDVLGRLDLWASTQAPYFVRKELAHVLDLDMDQIHTHDVAVGGGFGAKAKACQHEAIAAALSMQSGRPVRLVLDRAEEFTTTHTRHQFDIDLTTGATAQGQLTHRDSRMVIDNGAYNHHGPAVASFASMLPAALYRVQAAETRIKLVYTNIQPGSSFRGFANAQITFAMESQLDELADELGIDPIEFRIKNAHVSGDETLTGWRLESARLVECLEAVRDAIGWSEKRSAGGSGRGVGVAAAIHPSGARIGDGSEYSGAGVDIDADGRVRVRFAGSDAGTGQATILAQIAAGELGVALDDVDVTMMKSEGTPSDQGAWSSRGTMWGGHAVANTARAAADRLRDIAADKLGLAAEGVVLRDGQAHGGGESVDIGDLVVLSDETSDGVLRTEDGYLTGAEKMDGVSGISNFSPAYSFIAQAVEVEVDSDTGEVRVVQVVSAHDCGVAINPLGVQGQIVGSVAMGLGAALGEEMVHDDGRLVNASYVDYGTPRPSDLPPIRSISVGEPDPNGPYGAKGIGEIGLVPTPAAVANAVAHATGVRIRSLPITPDKLLPHLRPRAHVGRLWRRPDRWWIELVRRAYSIGLHRLLHRWGTRFARPPVCGAITVLDFPTSVESASIGVDKQSEFISGGTDVLVRRRQGLASSSRLIDLTAIRGLDRLEECGDGSLVIGAGTTLADLQRYCRAADPMLVEVLDQIATPQIREMATVAGNLLQANRCSFYRNGFDCYKRSGPTCPCYAVLGDHRFYHAVLGGHRCQAVTPSDLATAFLALDGVSTVQGRTGVRSIPLADLYRGPGESTLRVDEVMTSVEIPGPSRQRRSGFEKLGKYSGDFAIASAAVSLELDGMVVTDARIVLGAIAPVPYRARRTEEQLSGLDLGNERALSTAAAAWTIDAHPLQMNRWKVDAAVGLVRRALHRLGLESG